jgi:hypothetical protein
MRPGFHDVLGPARDAAERGGTAGAGRRERSSGIRGGGIRGGGIRGGGIRGGGLNGCGGWMTSALDDWERRPRWNRERRPRWRWIPGALQLAHPLRGSHPPRYAEAGGHRDVTWLWLFRVSTAGARAARAAPSTIPARSTGPTIPARSTGPRQPRRHPEPARDPGLQPARCDKATVRTVATPQRAGSRRTTASTRRDTRDSGDSRDHRDSRVHASPPSSRQRAMPQPLNSRAVF